jgi:hypothetical protein
MRNLRNLRRVLIFQMALIPAFAVAASAQPAGSNHPNPADTRRTINDETFRELMNIVRENRNPAADNSEAGRAAALKQLREDFKSIQNVNNKMMAEVWSKEAVDYERASAMIADINAKATRLKSNLALPEPDNVKRKNLVVAGAKEFKAALLLMDRSLMSFVTNKIFQDRNVMEVELATRASQDLDNVIALSANLRKVADNFKNSAANR